MLMSAPWRCEVLYQSGYTANHGDPNDSPRRSVSIRTLQPRSALLTPSSRSLQVQAIEKARVAFSQLPNGDAIFQQCLNGQESIPDILATVARRHGSYRSRKCTQLLEAFQRHTTWLQNISAVVDIVVQTQSGIGCPLWAPVKFVLQVRSCLLIHTSRNNAC
jgi:hypothetical protein